MTGTDFIAIFFVILAMLATVFVDSHGAIVAILPLVISTVAAHASFTNRRNRNSVKRIA